MSQINEESVKHIAKLARLKLSEAEIKKFSHDLSEIVKYVEQLGELDTTGIEPMVGAVEQLKELRQDQVIDSGLQEAMLKNAPDAEASAIKVPQMS